jgi:hypothetical protein
MDWKSGPLPVYTEFIRVYKTFINWLIIFKPRTALADLEYLHYSIAEAINHLSQRSGRISVYRKAGKYHSILKSQIATSSSHGGRRSHPYALTEYGTLMAANVWNSERAVQMNTACGAAVEWTALVAW